MPRFLPGCRTAPPTRAPVRDCASPCARLALACSSAERAWSSAAAACFTCWSSSGASISASTWPASTRSPMSTKRRFDVAVSARQHRRFGHRLHRAGQRDRGLARRRDHHGGRHDRPAGERLEASAASTWRCRSLGSRARREAHGDDQHQQRSAGRAAATGADAAEPGAAFRAVPRVVAAAAPRSRVPAVRFLPQQLVLLQRCGAERRPGVSGFIRVLPSRSAPS